MLMCFFWGGRGVVVLQCLGHFTFKNFSVWCGVKGFLWRIVIKANIAFAYNAALPTSGPLPGWDTLLLGRLSLSHRYGCRRCFWNFSGDDTHTEYLWWICNFSFLAGPIVLQRSGHVLNHFRPFLAKINLVNRCSTVDGISMTNCCRVFGHEQYQWRSTPLPPSAAGKSDVDVNQPIFLYLAHCISANLLSCIFTPLWFQTKSPPWKITQKKTGKRILPSYNQSHHFQIILTFQPILSGPIHETPHVAPGNEPLPVAHDQGAGTGDLASRSIQAAAPMVSKLRLLLKTWGSMLGVHGVHGVPQPPRICWWFRNPAKNY